MPLHAMATSQACCLRAFVSSRQTRSAKCQLVTTASKQPVDDTSSRRHVLHSSSILVLASLFHFGGPRPSGLGVQRYGSVSTLALCPRSPECISTAEEANDPLHYVPPWTYTPTEESRKLLGKQPISRADAMRQLVSAVQSSSPDGWTPSIVKQTDEYLYVEYESPVLGFVDDVEFWLPGGEDGRVEYRSASRSAASLGGDANRRRIRALREALQKKSWRSVGF